jgi:S1-C subfamily serine protease
VGVHDDALVRAGGDRERLPPLGTVGFAVPVDTIRKVVPQIIQYGKVIRPDLGGVSFVRDEVARRANVEGAVILEVPQSGQAYNQGLRGVYRDNYGRLLIRDVIVGIDQLKIKSYDDLFAARAGRSLRGVRFPRRLPSALPAAGRLPGTRRIRPPPALSGVFPSPV